MHDDQQIKKLGSQTCEEKKMCTCHACRLNRLQIGLGGVSRFKFH